jgi:hypothetical protein
MQVCGGGGWGSHEQTVAGRDAGVEPPGMGSRRVWKGSPSLLPRRPGAQQKLIHNNRQIDYIHAHEKSSPIHRLVPPLVQLH